MPGQYFYFDMRQSPREDGHDWAAIFDARKVYGFGFTEFSPEQMRNVEGLQGAFFSEAYVSHEPEKPDYLDYMLFPRVCALARIAWSGNAEGWDAYYEELKGKHYDRMAAMGIRFPALPAEGRLRRRRVHRFGGRRLRDLLPYGRLSGRTPLHGSGSAPGNRISTASIRATAPPAAPTWPTSPAGGPLRPPWRSRPRWARARSSPMPTPRATRAFRVRAAPAGQQDWIRYTFSEPVRCREMYLQTGNRQLPKTIVTTGYAEVSYDGATFERAGELEMGSITLRPGRPVKAVRIVSTCDDNGTPYVTNPAAAGETGAVSVRFRAAVLKAKRKKRYCAR